MDWQAAGRLVLVPRTLLIMLLLLLLLPACVHPGCLADRNLSPHVEVEAHQVEYLDPGSRLSSPSLTTPIPEVIPILPLLPRNSIEDQVVPLVLLKVIPVHNSSLLCTTVLDSGLHFLLHVVQLLVEAVRLGA